MITKEQANEVNKICRDSDQNEQNKKADKAKQSDSSKVGTQFKHWIIGVVVSFLPLLAVPLSNWVAGGSTKAFLGDVFQDYGIIYIAVSMAIVSLNNNIAYNGNKYNKLAVTSVITVVVGIFIYVVFAMTSKYEPVLRDGVIITINVIFILILIFIGFCEYLENMIREEA